MLSVTSLRNRPVPQPLPAAGTSGIVVAGAALLLGWGVKESTGMGSATVDVFDGSDATGQLTVPITLVTNESVRDWLGPDGLLMVRGIYVRATAGSASGSLWVVVLPGDAMYDQLAESEVS